LSGRPPTFVVTAATEEVTLDESGRARAPFTVTNVSAQPITGRLVPKPRRPAKPEWFSIIGGSIRDFAPDATEQVVVRLDIPPGSRPGSYRFRLDAVSEDNPDEVFTEGPFVAFEVAPSQQPKKPFPWWILAAAGAVTSLILMGLVVWLLVRDDGTKVVAVPSVEGRAETAARTILAEANLNVTVRYVGGEDPGPNLIVVNQDPEADTLQPPETVVRLTVGPTVVVPNVRGLSLFSATFELWNAGLPDETPPAPEPRLRARITWVRGPDDIVQSQNPAPGTRLPHGSFVEITVSL
jgi:hypothetical protein